MAPEVPEGPSASNDTAKRRGRKITFNYVVRVVLVPCSKELRPLSEHLWWGTDDYVDFRRQYVIAMRSAATAAASMQRDEEQQQPLPPNDCGPFANCGSDAESAALDTDEPTKTQGTKVVANLPPPSPLSSTNLATSLPATDAGAAEAAIPGMPTAAVTIGASGGHEQQEVPDRHALSTSNTPRSEPNARASQPPLSGSLPPILPPRSWAVSTTSKWTPAAGMTAAKAVAEAEEEGYRTESMSSASDGSLSGGDGGESDSDDDSQQEIYA
eukprot:g10794.t1